MSTFERIQELILNKLIKKNGTIKLNNSNTQSDFENNRDNIDRYAKCQKNGDTTPHQSDPRGQQASDAGAFRGVRGVPSIEEPVALVLLRFHHLTASASALSPNRWRACGQTRHEMTDTN